LGYQFNIFHDDIDGIKFVDLLDKLEYEEGETASFKDMTFKEELAWLVENVVAVAGTGWIGRLKLLYSASKYLWQKFRKAKGYPYKVMAETIDHLPLTPVAIARSEDEVTVTFIMRDYVDTIVEPTAVFCIEVTLYDTAYDPIFK